MRIEFVAVLSTVIVLTSCGTTPAPGPEQSPVPSATLTPRPPTPEASSTPEPTEVLRWMEYEDALAAELLPPSFSPGNDLCEWDILGQVGQELYVWAACQVGGISDQGTAISEPVIIYLSSTGAIEKVEAPDRVMYAEDIARMFPPELQPKIHAFSAGARNTEIWSHLQGRHKNPGPPLIALEGTPLP